MKTRIKRSLSSQQSLSTKNLRLSSLTLRSRSQNTNLFKHNQLKPRLNLRKKLLGLLQLSLKKLEMRLVASNARPNYG